MTPERIGRLREFGLSEYAARAYLALLDLGTAEARDVSNLSRVPQAKVYQVLEQLHEKGLAIVLPEFPKKYAPVPFGEYLERIHRQHVEAARDIERSREDLGALFQVSGRVEPEEGGGGVSLVRGREQVIERVLAAIAKAESEVLVVASFVPSRVLAEAAASGARVRVVVSAATDLPRADGVDVRVRQGVAAFPETVTLMVVDSTVAHFVRMHPEDGSRDASVIVDEPALVRALRALALVSWEAAGPAPRAVPVTGEAGRGEEHPFESRR